LLSSGIVSVDRDLLVVFHVHIVILAHGFDGRDEVGGDLGRESHEEVVFMGDDAALDYGLILGLDNAGHIWHLTHHFLDRDLELLKLRVRCALGIRDDDRLLVCSSHGQRH
jgi:hypothetical protein